MTFQKLPDPKEVSQVFPEKKEVLLEGLYLGQRLAEMSAKMGRTLVIASFLTDRKGILVDQPLNAS